MFFTYALYGSLRSHTLFGGLAEEFPVYDGNEVVPVASGRGLLKIFHVLPEQERMDRLVAHHISLEELEVNWRLQDFDKISTRYMYCNTLFFDE